jgi:hypothetical protein
VVVAGNDVQRIMPHGALTVRSAIRQALSSREIETRWSAAGPIPGDPGWAGGTVFSDERTVAIDAEAATIFAAVCRVGGGHGWYAGDLLWRIRGLLDKLIGGPGLRRGRRHPQRVEFGEALDFWRVVGIEPDRSLVLRAEMKLPGTAMLSFRIEPLAGRRHLLRMCARFRPRGLAGAAYWYSVVPFHQVVFGGMLDGIRRTAEASRIAPDGAGPDRNRAAAEFMGGT